jgi:putative transposase
MDRLREYIKNQEEHHSKKSFEEELEEIMKKYGFGKSG